MKNLRIRERLSALPPGLEKSCVTVALTVPLVLILYACNAVPRAPLAGVALPALPASLTQRCPVPPPLVLNQDLGVYGKQWQNAWRCEAAKNGAFTVFYQGLRTDLRKR